MGIATSRLTNAGGAFAKGEVRRFGAREPEREGEARYGVTAPTTVEIEYPLYILRTESTAVAWLLGLFLSLLSCAPGITERFLALSHFASL